MSRKNIHIVSASAGTGKTTQLARIMEAAMDDGMAPSGILATTFTRQAAAELQERARQQLLSKGEPQTAQAIGAAQIGTINAVCGQLVSRFALPLGLSPKLRVLSEQEARHALRECLHGDDAADLYDLQERLTELANEKSQLHIAASVQSIIDLARSNAIDAADLIAVSAERSCRELATLLGPADCDGAQLDNDLRIALEAFAARCPDVDAQVARDACTEVRTALEHMRLGDPLPWATWAKLADLKGGAKLSEYLVPVHRAASQHDVHPRLRADLLAAVKALFDLAATTMTRYETHKQNRGVIDFIDQEVLALRALDHPEVRATLREQLRLVLVDEFQDTSPLQLAIFLKLAELAPRSVWVGDQKQAIYGFRGTDPALMGGAVADLLLDDGRVDLMERAWRGAGRMTTLRQSWRSRPILVHLTSSMFAPAFAKHGIPRELVEIEPGHPSEPAGLGAAVEVWNICNKKSRGAKNHASEVAYGIAQMLQDETARIRDRVTQQARRPHPADIAVLCRTNDVCQSVATALAKLGIAVQWARPGVLQTPEGQVLLAGLRLWLEPSNALQRAVLARLLHPPYATEPARWLEDAIAAPGATAFADLPVIIALERAMADARARALPVDACVQACMTALNLREICCQWGDSAQRLANVDAMLALCTTYVHACRRDGEACTLAGLLYHLETVAQQHADLWGTLPSADEGDGGVTVHTWHGAKGLEWPVVILMGLEKFAERPTMGLGARAESDDATFDLATPLRGRWIRYWTTPYVGQRTGTEFYRRLREHPRTMQVQAQTERENLRLLYVAFTRARDRLVLTLQNFPEQARLGPLGLLPDVTYELPERAGAVRWGDTQLIVTRRDIHEAPVAAAVVPKPASMYAAQAPVMHPPARARPSDLKAQASVVRVVTLGPRLPLRGQPKMRALGDAIHAFFAGDDAAADVTQRLAWAEALLQAWHVAPQISGVDLLQAGDALRKYVQSQWPGAEWLTEVPLSYLAPSGTLISGTADLVLRHASGYILIDHKSYAEDSDEAMTRAVGDGGQLAAYHAAIRAATSLDVLHCFIHLPISGVLVEIRP